MTATLSRFYFGSDGELCKIVHPTADAEVLDARHDEPGKTGINILRSAYDACADDRAVFALVQPVIAQVKSLIGDLLTQRMALIDAFQTLRGDRDTLANRLVAGGDTPTPAQQLLITAAQVRVVNDLQDIQAIRDAVDAIKAQLN